MLEERIEALEQKVNAMSISDRWLTVPELAEEMKISQSTIRRRIKDKSIFTCKVFGAVRIPMSQFYERREQ